MMASLVDFLNAQPADVQRFVLKAIEPIWLDPKAPVAEAIKREFPGRFSDEEIDHLIYAAMIVMR